MNLNLVSVNGQAAVHPVADLFPMMSEEELSELAVDIKENGLINPIILDSDGTLIDGRNRQRACELAGVVPTYELLNGVDPVAFILSANDRRRHMTKGQRAMVAAKVRSLNEHSVRESSKLVGVSLGYVTQAAVILQYAPDLSDSVISGVVALNDAYTQAQARKKEQESDAGKMKRLRDQAPDLADQVTEEKLSLAEAIGALNAREQAKREEYAREKQNRQVTTRLFTDAVSLLDPRIMTPQSLAGHLLKYIDPKETAEVLTKPRLDGALAVFTNIVNQWKD